MISLYIDPGTGSMLFGIFIGIFGALYYVFKGLIVKVRFILSGGKKVKTTNKKIPFVIFSDDKRYWNVFEPVCRELDKMAFPVVYMTSSPDDPALKNEYDYVKAQFIGQGNKAFAKLNFLNARLMLSTTPGLDVYQWKRSKDVDYYVHMLHGPNEVVGYHMFGVDYYDALLLSGEYQRRDIRNLEKLRNLPAKEIEMIGVPYLDEMKKKVSLSFENIGKRKEILLAPSWGPSAILSKYGSTIIDQLLETGYHIIIRPHPQSYTAEKEILEELMKKYPNSAQLEWNRDNNNFDVLKRADLLISDFSGVIFDFSLVFDKPIIYADTKFDSSPYDVWWLDTPYWTFTALPRIGEKLTMDNISNLKNMIQDCLTNQKYVVGREEVKRETWVYPGQGAKRAANYIVNKYAELVENKKEGVE